MEYKHKITLSKEFLQELAIEGLTITRIAAGAQPKTVIVRELSPGVLFQLKSDIQKMVQSLTTSPDGEKQLIENISLVDEIKTFVEFGHQLLPQVSNINDEDLLQLQNYGFSAWRAIWNAFLEVNADFLWVLASLGVKTIFGLVLERLKLEGAEKTKQIIDMAVSMFLKDLEALNLGKLNLPTDNNHEIQQNRSPQLSS